MAGKTTGKGKFPQIEESKSFVKWRNPPATINLNNGLVLVILNFLDHFFRNFIGLDLIRSLLKVITEFVDQLVANLSGNFSALGFQGCLIGLMRQSDTVS